ncbi:uncharacterized protein LOC117117569 [Anneissia japonica]|uniref:uncharacterized protein LOC117117569 n=1 Tax=Anneissia japonica TaxID=1529436 RepID=UPI0014258193|nr:uncharacterized protein LOC117117569 [Anneissia japonica]
MCVSITKTNVDQDKKGLTKFAIIFIAVVFTITSTILLTIICCIIYRRHKDHSNYSLALSSPSTERDTEKPSDFQHHHLEMQSISHRDSDMFEEDDVRGSLQEERSIRDDMNSSQKNDEIDGDIDSLNLTTPKKVKRDMFLQQISNLRPSATVFLAMSNEVKMLLDSAKHGNPRIETFKDVVRDLSRVLFILNKKESDVKMPPDGIELLQWAAAAIKKYEECHEIADQGKDWKGMTPEVTKTMWIESKDEAVFKEAHSESALI